MGWLTGLVGTVIHMLKKKRRSSTEKKKKQVERRVAFKAEDEQPDISLGEIG
jgi:hypothetical protein